MVHTRPTMYGNNEHDHTRKPDPFPTQKPKGGGGQKLHKPHKPDDMMAVIPYKDVHKLFDMLNKHSNKGGGGYKKKTTHKKRKKKKKTSTLPPPTTKRTNFGPKSVKRTRLPGKKKRIHVSPIHSGQ